MEMRDMVSGSFSGREMDVDCIYGFINRDDVGRERSLRKEGLVRSILIKGSI